MKRRLILWTTILSLVFILFGLVSCSETNAPNRPLQEKDLVGKLWNLKKYAVVSDGKDGYRLKCYDEINCGFGENGKMTYFDGFNSTETYRISGEMFTIGIKTYQIKQFSKDFIELISVEELTSKEARESEFGFLFKIELRKK